ncbi:hypothetical protein LY90DRAFT_667978 [Neocallimastix californiae]|uniref:Uncharacterized protein n=1 Tax=Neocallimastix californiae TaxID=1754190 RepID=A0A1Y2E2E2_9FUNG|nr:hypothetical protein LY90DRAFT_667978 [Neocallimastix californiae]|eukprot:ORY65718.1 hypothetical protein LY90DRAFT_667978 [Neocallimastix californiae]
MSTMNYSYNNINLNNNNYTNETYYNMNTNDIYNNNKNNSSTLSNNYSLDSQNNINYQSNNILYINQNHSLNTQNNNYPSISNNNQNDISVDLNINSFFSHENELNKNKISVASNYNNNISTTSNNYNNNYNNNHNNSYDNIIIEATKKIPIIRFYVFIKKLKAKCVFKFLYQISYILNLFDINRRIKIINSIPFQLPKILQKIFLINFPIKIIENLIPNYKNYHIPTTQEIIAPFHELIISISSIHGTNNSLLNNYSNEILYSTNKNNYYLHENVNKIEKQNNIKCSMSPLLLPQSEVPCQNSPESINIIQTPTSFLNNDITQCNLDSKQNFNILKSNENVRIINNINNTEMINPSTHNNTNNNYHNNNPQQKIDTISILSSNKTKNDNICNEFDNNNIALMQNSLPEKKSLNNIITNSNKISNKGSNDINNNCNNNDNSDAPYNFLANNMKLQSNLTLFPLSPYITLKNSDFETDIQPTSNESKSSNQNTSDMPSNAVSSIDIPSNLTTTSDESSSPVATLSTVAASIAALKSSSTSSKHSNSSLSKNEKRNLSMIKGSNIVKNIVKNFEEINTFYKNSLLKAAENINNTKSAKRNSSKKSYNSDNDNDKNNESDNDKNNDENIKNESILEGDICQEPIDNPNLINNVNINKLLMDNEIEIEIENENENENENKNENENENENENKDLNEINLLNEDRLSESETKYKLSERPVFLKESDLETIKESTAILNSYYFDPNIDFNDNEVVTEIIKDFSLKEIAEEESESSNSDSNVMYNSLVNLEDLDITRLTILLIENFVKLSEVEKEEFLNSEYFELIKNHIMNIQNDDEIEFNNVLKDPKMISEFESHIEALQQCVKERDDIINYYYQEIVNERIQNEKLLIFCENEQLEREETNKVISGLTKKIEVEEDYIKKLEVRCEMLIEKVKKYQSCCKHYEKSISLLSGNKANSIKLINTQNIDNWKINDLTEPLNATGILSNPPSFVPTAAQTIAAANSSNYKISSINTNVTNNNGSSSSKFEESTTSLSNSTSSSSTLNNETSGRPGISHLIDKLNCEKISKNEEIQYLKSLLKSYNGKHIYINENVIKKQIIRKTTSDTQNVPATINNVPIIPVSTSTPIHKARKLSSSKKMMMNKYFNDENQYSKVEDTIIVSDDDNENDENQKIRNLYGHEMNYINEEDNENENNNEEEDNDDDDEDNNDLMKNGGGKSIDLSIIDDLNIFNEKHYQEKVLNSKHQEYNKSYEDDTFSEYAPTLVN